MGAEETVRNVPDGVNEHAMSRNLGYPWSMLRKCMTQVVGSARLHAVLGRLKTIAVAYLSASLISGLVIALPFLLGTLANTIYEGNWQEAAAYTLTAPVWIFLFAAIATMFIAVFTFAPAMLVIAVAEAVRVRAAAFYGWTGTIAAIVSYEDYIIKEGRPARPLHLITDWTLADMIPVLYLAASGAIGGLVYWHCAGASAGDWRVGKTHSAVDQS